MSRAVRSIRGPSALLFFFVLGCLHSLLAQERDSKLDSLAGDLAHQLSKVKAVKERHGAPVSYLVFDFADAGGHITQLGVHLADEVSEAMNNRLPGLSPLPRSKLQEMYDLERIDGSALASDRAAGWAASTLGASLAIVGSIDSQGNELSLHVRVLDHRLITVAGASQLLERTDETRGWEKSIPAQPPPSLLPPRPGLAHVGRNGVGAPVCISCPSPHYTEAARQAGFSGSVILGIIIGTDGDVLEARPLRGSPYGLTGQALAMVRTWRFQPITGLDGNPVVVEVPVEVNFRLLEKQ